MSGKWFYELDRATNYSTSVTVKTTGQVDITWDRPYIMYVDMLLVHRNGVEQSHSVYSELDANTIRFIPNYLEQGDEISIHYIPASYSLGDIRVVANYAELVISGGASEREVALSVGNRKFYIFKSGKWGEFIIPMTGQNIGILFRSETQQIASKTTYTLNEIRYTFGNLLVFIDGIKVDSSMYVEIDDTTIEFNEPTTGINIEFMSAETDSWQDSYNHSIVYAYNSLDVVTKETISVGTVVMQTTDYTYDSIGNLQTEIIVRGGKTITKTYTFNTSGNVTRVEVTIS